MYLFNSTVDNKEWTDPYRNKGIYSGGWSNNNPQGQGKYTRSDGGVYTGEFKDNNVLWAGYIY